METPLFVRNVITINAPVSTVWDVLTNPAQTKKYMFGCETFSDWKPGSPLTWVAPYEGKEMVFVKGTIVSIQPGKHLVYTTFDPNSTMADVPENYLNVTYDLSEENGKTIFRVEQGDFSRVADGQKRYNDAWNKGEGWQPVLVAIKAVAEAIVG